MIYQVITGIVLCIVYSSGDFECVNRIMVEHNGIHITRFGHVWGPTVVFSAVFFHICKGIWYGSYQKTLVWNSGLIILLLLMRISFLGYVLVWRNISYWAATVITNLISVLPIGRFLLSVL